MSNRSNRIAVVWLLLLWTGSSVAQEAPAAKNTDNPDHAKDIPAGQSLHGEVFNEGPRQKAYFMAGVGKVRFPVSTQNDQVQKFVEQGVAQLHGFWYFEAERSFRQAAAIEPDCAMAYWGMAQANRDNEKRSKGFIAEAVKRKDKVSKREQMYIDAWDAYWKIGSDKKKERVENYTKAIEKIIYEFPDDLEAKALLVLQLWMNRDAGVPITSYLALDALLDQIFAVDPMHPVHHYRIHLWDYERAERALASAARCGQTAPGIAHMWHMPGHIYSRLKRYEDACWQQEASARVDHAHMMRDHILPDQIHNLAHNNEWFIRNLNSVGRVRDAVDLAKNMLELPRHPKYNGLSKSGSAKYGRQRLWETLERYELWDEMLALSETTYLDATEDEGEQTKRLRQIGAAYYRKGELDRGNSHLASLQPRLKVQQDARDKAGNDAAEKIRIESRDKAALDKSKEEAKTKAMADGKDEAGIAQAQAEAEQKAIAEQDEKNKEKIEKAKNEARKPLDAKVLELEKAVNELEGHKAVSAGDLKGGRDLLKKAGGVDEPYLALLTLLAGETDEAIKSARKHVADHSNEVQPLAALVDLLWRAGKKDDAKIALTELQQVSNSIDLQSPVFARVGAIAKELGSPDDWRVRKPASTDVGERPTLDSLGPFRWQPTSAANWVLNDSNGQPHSLREYYGRPVIVMFYLGSGCLHCVEQLKKFTESAKDFSDAGFALVAISTDTAQNLQTAIKNYTSGPYPIALLVNDKLDVFKQYRVFDDFEQRPLHATFVIDAAGLVRWQDISFEPFMDAKFVLHEAQRLLRQGAPTTVPNAAVPVTTSE